MNRGDRAGTHKGPASTGNPSSRLSDSAPGSSRQQDALVGPLDAEEARRVAGKRLRLYRFVYWTLRFPVRWVLRVKSEGVRNVPKKGGAILAVNHVSSFDPPAVLVALKRPYVTLAKAGIMARPIKRFFVETLGGMIRVDRSRRGNEAAVEAACLAVENGKLLAVWPEGGRSPTGRIMRAHTGIARIALRTGAPVIPVAVTGTFEVKSKNQEKIRWGTPVKVRFGEPMVFAGRQHEAEDRHVVREVTDEIMLEVARLLGHHEVERHHRLVERDVPPGVLPPEDTKGADEDLGSSTSQAEPSEGEPTGSEAAAMQEVVTRR